MKKRSAVLIAVFLLVSICAFASAKKEAVVQNSTGHDLTSGSPWLASNVEGVVKKNTKVSAKDDFYLYVNKGTILSEKIQQGYASAGTISKRRIENDKDIMSLFSDKDQKTNSADAQMALDLYSMLIDWETRNKHGVEPLKKLVNKLEAISGIEDLNNYYKTAPYEEIIGVLFPTDYMTDLEDNSKYIMVLGESALLLGDSAEYSKLTEAGKIEKEALSKLLVYLLERQGYSKAEAEKKLDNCFELEAKLASSIMTLTEHKSPDYLSKILNRYSAQELKQAQGIIPIMELLEHSGYKDVQTVLVTEPKWLDNLKQLYTDDNIALIKDYLIVWMSLSYAKCLDKDCFTHYLDYANTVNGVTGYLSDEQYAVSATKSYLRWQVAKLYCEKFFTEKDKENVKQIMEKVLDCYSQMLANNTFLSEQTKKKAQEKLKTMTLNSLYPDDWTLYSYNGLVLKEKEDDSLLDCLNHIGEYEHKRKIERFYKPVDKTYWSFSDPTVVNAYYSPSNNSINMLAAFCRGDLYNRNMSTEEMYATIGAVIGHEISHAFDGRGSQYDKYGNLNNWWTDEDRANFNRKIKKMADYASSVTYWDDVHLNGAIMTGEICADMGGISVMLKMAKDIKNFNYRKFFKNYAKLWEGLDSYNFAVATMSDVHPPKFFRVNATLQQFDEFLDCYHIKQGDRMYLAPEDRVAIW